MRKVTSTNETFSKHLAYFLGRTDSRTIKDIADKYPLLYGFMSMFPPGMIEQYRTEGTLGTLEYFLSLSQEELAESKNILSLLQGRSMEDIGKMISKDANESKTNMSLSEEKLGEYILFQALNKLESFYKSKIDGKGLKDILTGSIRMNKQNNVAQDAYKPNLLGRIEGYRTSLMRGEVEKHKIILSDFIRDNLSEIECELVVKDCEGQK